MEQTVTRYPRRWDQGFSRVIMFLLPSKAHGLSAGSAQEIVPRVWSWDHILHQLFLFQRSITLYYRREISGRLMAKQCPGVYVISIAGEHRHSIGLHSHDKACSIMCTFFRSICSNCSISTSSICSCHACWRRERRELILDRRTFLIWCISQVCLATMTN